MVRFRAGLTAGGLALDGAGSAGRPVGLGVRRLSRRSMSREIAAQLKEYILSHGVGPGERLPTEQELSEAFGVSRAAVREGLKILEGSGLVVTRPGAAGGARVAIPSRGLLADSFTALVQLARVPVKSLIEFRVALERLAVRRAAQQAGETDLAALRRLLERMGEPTLSVAQYNELDLEFHTAIADASKNEALALVMHAVRHAINRAMARAYERLQDPLEVNRRLTEEHRAIADRIAAGDAEGAERLVVEHLEGFYSRVLGLRLARLWE